MGDLNLFDGGRVVENEPSLVGGDLACVCWEEDSGSRIRIQAKKEAWLENRPWGPRGSERHIVHSDWTKVGKQKDNRSEKRQPGSTATLQKLVSKTPHLTWIDMVSSQGNCRSKQQRLIVTFYLT